MAIAPERGPSLAWHGPRPKRPSNEARLQECQKSREELTRHPIVRPSSAASTRARRPRWPVMNTLTRKSGRRLDKVSRCHLLAFFKPGACEEDFSKKLAGHD